MHVDIVVVNSVSDDDPQPPPPNSGTPLTGENMIPHSTVGSRSRNEPRIDEMLNNSTNWIAVPDGKWGPQRPDGNSEGHLRFRFRRTGSQESGNQRESLDSSHRVG